MIVAGHQPNYLPWLGFFDKMSKCDIFIVEDNVQYERNGFTNRNRINTSHGPRWLTVPVEHEGRFLLINEVRIANSSQPKWAECHWLSLKHHYMHTPYWSEYSYFFEETYNKKWDFLIDLNMHLIKGIMKFLNIDKPLVMASSLDAKGKKTELIIAQCKAVGANVQLSGKGSKSYIDDERFKQEGIKLIYQEFEYPVYAQTRAGFIPDLSVVDYLFCNGAKIHSMLKIQGEI